MQQALQQQREMVQQQVNLECNARPGRRCVELQHAWQAGSGAQGARLRHRRRSRPQVVSAAMPTQGAAFEPALQAPTPVFITLPPLSGPRGCLLSGHVLESLPGRIVDALHHGLDLLPGAQLVQLVLACGAAGRWAKRCCR